MVKILYNGVLRDATAEEQSEYDATQTAYTNNASSRKLAEIKEIRLQKLKETDWWVLRGNMTEEQSTYRQNLRNVPQDYTTEDEYDLLLARDEQGNLTHSVWTKP